MRKFLGLIGLIAACGVCCAVPLLLPMLGGLVATAAGLAMGWELLALGGAGLVVVVLLFVHRRHRQSAGPCKETSPPSGDCGCQSSCAAQKG